MKDGHCPKCGSANVYMKHRGVYASGGGDNFLIVHISTFSDADFDDYLCADCGYIESYIADKSKLPVIASKWAKVK